MKFRNVIAVVFTCNLEIGCGSDMKTIAETFAKSAGNSNFQRFTQQSHTHPKLFKKKATLKKH
jgi:hypothetical protein